MNFWTVGVLIYLCIHIFPGFDFTREERFSPRRGFLFYRTLSITQRSCTCALPYSCSCCRNVVILYTKMEKNLCVNFTYQRNGLNIDVTLNSDILRTRTVTNYKPLKFCVFVPGCLFSMACINVLELNRFPRSITICLRLDIYSKKQLWQINYDCVSVSTELPMMPTNATTRTAGATEVPVVQEGTKVDRPLELPTTIAGMSNAASTSVNVTASIDGTTMMSSGNATMGMPTEGTTPATMEPTSEGAAGMVNATMPERRIEMEMTIDEVAGTTSGTLTDPKVELEVAIEDVPGMKIAMISKLEKTMEAMLDEDVPEVAIATMDKSREGILLMGRTMGEEK